MNAISRAKDALQTPDDFLAENGGDFRLRKIGEVYVEYQKSLKLSNALDFDDIIMQTVRLLRENEDVRRYYQNKFKYVCVDEFQDTNVAQFELTALRRREMENLAAAIEPTEGNVCLFFEDADMDALRSLVNAVAEKCRICAAFSGAEGQYRYIIASRSEDLRAMGKEINAAIGGRGGGSSEMIQGSATAKAADIRTYFEG